MLTLRQEQIDTLSGAIAERFDERILAHLSRFFPKRCLELGEDGTRSMIRDGIKRASRHGFVTERDVCKYIDLMFALGSDFDRDPGLPWVVELLRDKDTRDGLTRMDRLCKAAIGHLRDRGDGNVKWR